MVNFTSNRFVAAYHSTSLSSLPIYIHAALALEIYKPSPLLLPSSAYSRAELALFSGPPDYELHKNANLISKTSPTEYELGTAQPQLVPRTLPSNSALEIYNTQPSTVAKLSPQQG